MSQEVPWLPDACLRDDRACRRLNQTIAEWSRRWLPHGRWHAIGPMSQVDDGADDGEWSVLRTGGRSTIEGTPGAVLRLALAMLGDDDRSSLSPRDRKFLRRLASQAIDDLIASVDELLPGSDGLAATWVGKPWSLPIGPAAEPLLQVSIATSDLCLLARQAFPQNAVGALDSRCSAVADMRVPISVHLGMARMDVAQFDALEPGDVIVLDRSVTSPASLLVAGRLTALPCTVSQQDSALLLHLAESD
jgi:flagellar motor switch/type III secretory pathway protein FliN